MFALLRLTKAKDMFHNAAIVPAAIKENEFARRRQMINVALKIPLRAFRIRGFRKRHHARAARVKVFPEAFDCAAFSGGISPLKHHGHARACFLGPGLQLHQFDLQRVKLCLVGFTLHPSRVGVAL